MFNCPSCKLDAKRLIGTVKGLFCDSCFKKDDYRPTYLHQILDGQRDRRLTIAKSNEIANRMIREGKVVDRRTGKTPER